MITRRRFLSVTAAALALPASAAPIRWQSRAMGADVSLILDAPQDMADAAILEIENTLARVETLFSLYRPDSALSRLNTSGSLAKPDPEIYAIMRAVDQAHTLTHGHFDPTVQPLWMAFAKGQNTTAARALIGWSRVMVSPGKISLAPGQSLTLNGIAQGFATDLVTAILKARGFARVLVNIGEFNAIGGPWRIGIEDPTRGLVAARTLTDRAIATSSPGAMQIGNTTHILNPKGTSAPLWSSVCVQAPSAALADALSTGFCTMTQAEIASSLRNTDATATLIPPNGEIITL